MDILSHYIFNKGSFQLDVFSWNKWNAPKYTQTEMLDGPRSAKRRPLHCILGNILKSPTWFQVLTTLISCLHMCVPFKQAISTAAAVTIECKRKHHGIIYQMHSSVFEAEGINMVIGNGVKWFLKHQLSHCSLVIAGIVLPWIVSKYFTIVGKWIIVKGSE